MSTAATKPRPGKTRATRETEALARIAAAVRNFQNRPQYSASVEVEGLSFRFTKFGPAMYDVRQVCPRPGTPTKRLRDPLTVTCPVRFLLAYLFACLPEHMTVREFERRNPDLFKNPGQKKLF